MMKLVLSFDKSVKAASQKETALLHKNGIFLLELADNVQHFTDLSHGLEQVLGDSVLILHNQIPPRMS